MRLRLLLAVAVCLCLFRPAAAEAPSVFVTIKPLHALAAGVMGDVGTPYLLVTGSHGGYIEVESGVDKGSVFYIYLPVSKIDVLEADPELPRLETVGSRN